MLSTTRTLIITLLAAGALAAGMLALRPPAAVATEETPFTQLRQTLRSFQTLRLWATYLSPQFMAEEERGRHNQCDLHEPRLECAHGGLFTLTGDGRMSWDAGLDATTRRILFEPPNIYSYYVDSFVNPPPDSPAALIPYFETAFALIRSGFGDAPAVAGTAEEFGHYSEWDEDVTWYRVPVAHPSFGEAELFLVFDLGGYLGEVDFVHETGNHRIKVGHVPLVNFELEPRWFDHDLTQLRRPLPPGQGIPDTGDGPPDGRAKVIE